MITRRRLLSSAAAVGAVSTAAACSPAKNGASSSSGAAKKDTLTFRLWDDSAKAAYKKSFEEFTNKTGIAVSIDVVPWKDYWTKLPLDIASGDGPDVFWMNSANYVQFQQSGNLVNISETVKENADKWQKAVVDLYTRDGALWGVPQLWDSIALFYNKSLTDKAGVDPTKLAFDPAAKTDALRDAATKLTLDEGGKHPGEPGFDPAKRKQFGFNAQADRQAIIGPFLASNGAEWEQSDKYVFASQQGIAAFGYLADLVNKAQVAPPAADTNQNGDVTKDLFTQGKLALFQTGPYNLKSVAEGVGSSFEWAVAPMVKGPAGAKSLVHGVVAVGNAKADKSKTDAIAQLLTWLGSKEGQMPIAEQGVAFPGHTDAQQAFVDFWKGKRIDVQQFIEAAKDPAPADTGAKANAGLMAALPVFQDIFAGRIAAAAGLPKAQKAGNDAMK